MPRATTFGLLLVLLTASGVRAADDGLILRWPDPTDTEEQPFAGGDFLPLTPAPIVGEGSFSVSVWINAADLAGGDATYGRGVARSTRGEQVGDWVLAVHRDGRVRFCNWRTRGDDKQGSHLTRKPLVTVGAWALVTATWDGKTNQVFVNGVEAAHDPGATATGWGVGHEVGRSWTDRGYFWDGQIRDLRVCKRVLTAVEIEAVLKAGPPAPPAPKAAPPAGDPKVSREIDRLVLAPIRKANVTVAPAACDAEFHRRATLDLAGRIPTGAETEAFLTDKASDKHLKLVETLLAGREMPLAWAQVLSGWLMPKEGRRDPGFVGYLRRGLAKNKPWDRFVREMLAAPAPGPSDQAAGLFLGYRKAALKDGSIARDVGLAFFGVNLRCAQCHDHPHVPQWTLERFYGLSAFFARTAAQPAAPNQIPTAFGEKATGEVEYTAAGKKVIAVPVFLDGTAITETPSTTSRREALARVALAPGSKYLPRALVNRVWQRLMGRGLVEPVDMMHEGNPATHPELLDLLADDFATHNFDLRRLIAVIMQSEAYGRASRWPGVGNLPDERLYAVAVLKPLDADQLALSLPVVAGDDDRPAARGRAVTPWKEVLAEFESDAEEFEPTTSQALFLTNSDFIQTQFLVRGKLARSLAAVADDAALARKAYLAILSREPSADETARISGYLRDRGSGSRAEACRELVWALVTSAEFRFNH